MGILQLQSQSQKWELYTYTHCIHFNTVIVLIEQVYTLYKNLRFLVFVSVFKIV